MMNDKSEAYMNGWHAHKAGIDGTNANPYNELTQPYSHRQWVSGWCARFGCLKHDEDTSELDNCEGW